MVDDLVNYDLDELNRLSMEGNWMTNYKLPDGQFTKKMNPKRLTGKDYNKTKMLLSLDVRGKRVLDFGCSEGIYSFYLADNGADVVGVDLDEKRIKKAKFMKKILGYDNVSFICGSIFDRDLLNELPHFDLIIAWGFLHRVPDPFNALTIISSKCDTISLEWRAPAMLFPRSFSVALHLPTGNFEWKNLNQKAIKGNKDSLNLKGEELAEFFRVSPGYVESILNRQGFGFYNYNKIKNEINFLNLSKSWIKFWLTLFKIQNKPFSWSPSCRIHLLAERNQGSLSFNSARLKDQNLADWDGRFIK